MCPSKNFLTASLSDVLEICTVGIYYTVLSKPIRVLLK